MKDAAFKLTYLEHTTARHWQIPACCVNPGLTEQIPACCVNPGLTETNLKNIKEEVNPNFLKFD